ncbi:MAG: hypothetical protein WC873_00775 [Candidatus Gracilibacteria bacterium]
MKKILLSLAIISLLLLTSCGKYTVKIENLPPELKAKWEKELDENLAKYDDANDPYAKSQLASEVGFRYMNLGKYSKAISYYEEVLAYDNVHFPALNNLAFIYEEVGEIQKALEYEKRLYEANPLNKEVVGDTVRLLVKNYQFEDATKLLTTYTINSKNEDPQFISDTLQFIIDSRDEATGKLE